MEPSEYENIARLQDRHWWYRGMAAISLSLLAHYRLTAPALGGESIHILDAGCGPGGMLARLAALGQPIGLDFHPLALTFARHHPLSMPLLRASVTQIPIANNCFDLITSFDVLCHRAVSDDALALTEFWRLLKPGGLLMLRVPALETLRGAHDVVVHTQRRYTRQGLLKKLDFAGFQCRRLTYANTLLLPLIWLRRHLQTSSAEPATDVELPSPLVNKLFEGMLDLERRWLTHFNFPIGVSLLALASKPSAIR